MQRGRPCVILTAVVISPTQRRDAAARRNSGNVANEKDKPDGIPERPVRRSREDILREIKLALTIGDGQVLEAHAERARGFDPYDHRGAGRADDVWKKRRRD